ncbi:MAG TPA: diiron oxygenase [Planctomycetota bacterium]|nr:diiron oxygenase [Planctomycetota bacterium]
MPAFETHPAGARATEDGGPGTRWHRIYRRAVERQWDNEREIDWSASTEVDPRRADAWRRLVTIFHTLESMGLVVINEMANSVGRRVGDPSAPLYLGMQVADEVRHVDCLRRYLTKLGQAPKRQPLYDSLGLFASKGFARTENWLASTLFSENFATVFLRSSIEAGIDPFANQFFRSFLKDEARHVNFLENAIPDVYERLGSVRRGAVKVTQFALLRFAWMLGKRLDDDARAVGLDRRALYDEVFQRMEDQWRKMGFAGLVVPPRPR